MIYLDSSALVKLLLPAPETAPLSAWLVQQGDVARISSALVRVEVARALRAAVPAGRLPVSGLPGLLAAGDALVRSLDLVNLRPDLLVAAAGLGDPALRALDALHVATAQAHRRALTFLVTYDERLGRAAAADGLPVASPA